MPLQTSLHRSPAPFAAAVAFTAIVPFLGSAGAAPAAPSEALAMLDGASSAKGGGAFLSTKKPQAPGTGGIGSGASIPATAALGLADDLRINEIRIGGVLSSSCKDSELVYVEITGPPGASLDPVALVQIGEGNVEGQSGVVERVIRFTGKIMPPDGIFVVVGPGFCAPGVGPDLVSAQTLVSDVDNNTFLLARNFSALPNTDLDTNNDCVLDVTPWAVLVDAVAFRYADLPNCVYSLQPVNQNQPTPIFEPSAATGKPPMQAFRCETSLAWLPGVDVYGLYQPGVPAAYDTPGKVNPVCEEVACPLEGECCEAHDGIGCEDSVCCETVCAIDDSCCWSAWDQNCADRAIDLCECTPDPFAPVCPDQPEKENCFSAHATPGCDQLACEVVVCDIEPFCCDEFWDQGCALTAFAACVCGNPLAPACSVPHGGLGCNDCNCCTLVCEIDPFCCTEAWDVACAVTAQVTCVTCGSSNAESCCIIHQGPACSDAECCAAVCAQLIDCCIVSWDFDCAVLAAQICPPCGFCGDPATGSCYAAHQQPGCEDVQCCVRVCSNDPYCCGITWDEVCADAAQSLCFDITACDTIGSGVTCFDLHPTLPGCSDANCCSAVCSLQSACCDIGWDQPCVDLALAVCSPFVCGSFSEGSCVLPTGLPGCNFGDCCLAVCGQDPTCCLTGWDSGCVDIAFSLCCGLAGSGSCFEPDGAPFCDDADCCSTVCFLDKFCCDEAWDQVCAEEARELCKVPCLDVSDGIRSCYIPHAPGGCDDVSLCRTVCTIDPYCCERIWDALCVEQTLAFPHGPFYTVCPAILGSCYQAHPGPGCTDELCCKAICSIDDSCCSAVWDAFCAEQALVVCQSGLFDFPPPCPAEGDCFEQLLTPGCGDQVCCTVVCQIDPVCCLDAWDFTCVFLANSLCDDFLPDRCIPSAASCFAIHDTPYCRSADCSDAVCVFDLFCCEEAWDSACVSSAFTLCGDGGGSLLAGECYEPHASAGCSDWACSERVCFDDGFCCSFAWDALCAELAIALCAEGPCFAFHETAGCSSAVIMLTVCGAMPECCLESWDTLCAQFAQEKFLPLTQPDGPGQCTGNICVPDCGDEDAGDCFTARLTPNCDDDACCITVCESDLFCCQQLWDDFCVNLAKSNCARLWADEIFPAGDLCAGPCFLIKPLPNCNDEECSDLVCVDLAFCCELEWDALCVEQALWACLECGDEITGACYLAHVGPYCNDEECCEAVCLSDSFCCALGGNWDLFCVEDAVELCVTCGSEDAGGCCTAHGTPFCNDLLCCFVVCEIDPGCCTEGIGWDQLCADLAIEVCSEAACLGLSCGSEDAGGCFDAHDTPFCDDQVCCEFVCGLVEPSCCEVIWDELCVQAAEFICFP